MAPLLEQIAAHTSGAPRCMARDRVGAKAAIKIAIAAIHDVTSLSRRTTCIQRL